jgi:type II secretory pathway pseudopilin PulG
MDNRIKNSGFTLMETVIALGLGLITTALVMSVFSAGLKNIRTIKNTQVLNSSATFFLDKVTYWIKQGKKFDVSPTKNKLTITLPDNTTTIIDKMTFGNSDMDATTTFTLMKKSVQLNFIIQKGSEILSATTTIAQRAF